MNSNLRRVWAGAAFGAAALLTAAAAHAVTPVVLANPGFESPGCAGNCILGTGSSFITGWTTFNTGVEYFSPQAFGGTTAPGGGLMVVDLANYTHSAGGIRQSFATDVGQVYALSFWAGNVKASGRDGTGDVRVQVGNLDQTVATAVATSSVYAWKQIDLQFTATATTTTLQFSNTQDANTHFALIDVASVTAVPEPGIWALTLAGLAGLGLVRRGQGAGAR